jgi:hypothetical protein
MVAKTFLIAKLSGDKIIYYMSEIYAKFGGIT